MRSLVILCVLVAGCATRSEPTVNVDERALMDKHPERPAKEISSIPEYFAVKDSDSPDEFVIRYYLEPSRIKTHEIAIVTVRSGGGERIATVEESVRAQKLLQDQLARQTEAKERAVAAFYNARLLRESSGLEDRIGLKESRVRELEKDIEELQCQIKAEEQVNKGANQKAIAFWYVTMNDKFKELETYKAALAVLRALQAMRDYEIQISKDTYPHSKGLISLEDQQKTAKTQNLLTEIYALCAKYHDRFHRYPDPREDLVAQLETLYGGAELGEKFRSSIASQPDGTRGFIDAWGNSVRYVFVTLNQIRLSSRGADGKWDNEEGSKGDDIHHPY